REYESWRLRVRLYLAPQANDEHIDAAVIGFAIRRRATCAPMPVCWGGFHMMLPVSRVQRQGSTSGGIDPSRRRLLARQGPFLQQGAQRVHKPVEDRLRDRGGR